MERQWEQEPSHHPEGQVQRALWLQAMYCARRFYAELVALFPRCKLKGLRLSEPCNLMASIR